jgi:hypothetical protein
LQHNSTAYITEAYVLVVTKLHANFKPYEHWFIIEKITPPSLFVDEVEQGPPDWRAVKNILSPLNPPPMHFTVFDQQVVNKIFRESWSQLLSRHTETIGEMSVGVRRYGMFQIRALVDSGWSGWRKWTVPFVIHKTAFLILDTIVKYKHNGFDLYRRHTRGEGIDYVIDAIDYPFCIRFTAFEDDRGILVKVSVLLILTNQRDGAKYSSAIPCAHRYSSFENCCSCPNKPETVCTFYTMKVTCDGCVGL